MSDIYDKLDYLDDTKQLIRNVIEEKGQVIDDELPFRDYADKIKNITSGDVSLFKSMEEMNNDNKPFEGKLATVYNKETLNYEGLFEYKLNVTNYDYVKLYGALMTDSSCDSVSAIINYDNCDRVNLAILNEKVQSLLESINLDTLSGLCVCYNIVDNIPEYIEIYSNYNVFLNPQYNYLCADINRSNPSIMPFYKLNFINNSIEELSSPCIVTDYKVSDDKIISIYLCKSIKNYFGVNFTRSRDVELIDIDLSASPNDTTDKINYFTTHSQYIKEPGYVFIDSQLSNITSNNIIEGKTLLGANGSITGTMSNKEDISFTPSKEEQIIPEGYYNGNGKVHSVYLPNDEYDICLDLVQRLNNEVIN